MSPKNSPRVDAPLSPVGQFELPPPIPGPWRVARDPELALLRARLIELNIPEFEKLEISAIRLLAVSFHPGYLLCDIALTQEAEAAGCASLLYGPVGAIPLRGDAMPIHTLNMFSPPSLGSMEAKVEYLRFFCTFVHGAEGPFTIFDPTTSFTASKDVYERVAQHLLPNAPPTSERPTESGTELFQTLVHYSSNLFVAGFSVESDGRVIMREDTPFADDVTLLPKLVYEGAVRRLAAEP